MTKSEVSNRVAEIRALAKNEPAAATAKEDAMYIDVLTAIADGLAEDTAGVARIALSAKRLRFVRVYA